MALMTAAEVVTEAINNKNFDSALIKTDFILAAELDDIKPVLGDDFYDYIVANSGSYATLLVYIKKALAFFTLEKALPFIHAQMNNAGVMVNETDWAKAATDQQRGDLSEMCGRIGKIHVEEMKRYLTANNTNTLYSLWSGNDRKKFGGVMFY